MTKSEIRDFTSGNITKQLLIFASPLFLSNLLQIIYGMVDMVIVGAVDGTTGISAVSIGGDLTALLTFVGMGFGSAGQVIIARYIGAGRRDALGRFVGVMTSFLLLSAAIISAVALLLRDPLLVMMSTPSEAYDGALAYSVICMLGLVFIYGYNVVSGILRGMGDSKHPFIFIGIAAVLNIVLDVILVMGLGMGPAGAALATVVSQGVSFVSSAIFLYIKRRSFELDISPTYFIHWDRGMLVELCRLGVPMAIKMAAIQISKLFVNSWINGYGLVISAFAGIANKISSIANLISTAMNTAGSTMVGQNIAAARFDRVHRILANLAVITLAVAAVFSVSICLFPSEIFGLFDKNPEVLAIGDGYVSIAVLLFIAGALRSVANALLNGSGDYKMNFVTAIFDGIVMRIGLAVLFGLVLDMRHYGFWLGDAIAGFTPFIVGAIFYISGLWKRGAMKKKD